MQSRQSSSVCCLVVVGCCLFLAIGLLIYLNLLLLTDPKDADSNGIDQSARLSNDAWTANPDVNENSLPRRSKLGQGSSCAVPRMASKHAAIERLAACLLSDQLNRFEPFNRSRLVNFTDQNDSAGCGQSLTGRRHNLLTGVYNSSQLAKRWPSVAQFLTFIGNGTFNADKQFNQSWTDRHRLEKLHAYTRYLMTTQAMRSLYATLFSNGLIPTNQTSIELFFNATIYPLWFQFYGRRKKKQKRGFYNSCGFEHVFVGELRGPKVVGFHNWLQMLVQEESENLSYRGYYGVQHEPAIVASICFDWFNRKKKFSTLIIGVEPEFELALYTATHLLKANGVSKLMLDAVRGWRIYVQNYETDFAVNNVHAAYMLQLKD